jgi:hypothetical protein
MYLFSTKFSALLIVICELKVFILLAHDATLFFICIFSFKCCDWFHNLIWIDLQKIFDMDILWYNICMSAFYGTNCLAKKLDCIYVFYACDSTLVNHIPNRDRIMGTPDS